MVNTTIVSRYSENFPNSDTDRKITNGPLYPASDVLELLANPGAQSIKTWTNKCTRDVQKLNFDENELSNLLKLALISGRFIGAEWCTQKPNGPWAACDAYSVHRDERIPTSEKIMNIKYYMKFAISKTGNILFLVSCHF